MHAGDHVLGFAGVESVAVVLDSLVQVVGDVHARLVEESAPGHLVELSAQEVSLGALSLGFFTCELDFESGLHESEITGNFEVELEHASVEVEAGPEEKRAGVLFP